MDCRDLERRNVHLEILREASKSSNALTSLGRQWMSDEALRMWQIPEAQCESPRELRKPHGYVKWLLLGEDEACHLQNSLECHRQTSEVLILSPSSVKEQNNVLLG
ncbi:uncharacterized protein O8D03_000346 isoform 2-T2 [Erethizon dorsatum]